MRSNAPSSNKNIQLRLQSEDTLYAKARGVKTGSFTFDQTVASMFSDMARRSIPCYEEIQRATAALVVSSLRASKNYPENKTEKYPENKTENQSKQARGGWVLDIGASLGASVLEADAQATRARLSSHAFSLCAADYSEAFLPRLAANLAPLKTRWNAVRCVKCDIADAGERAALLKSLTAKAPLRAVIANFVLQFTPREARGEILRELYDALAPGGLLIISEKLRARAKAVQQVWDARYKDFKKENGYSAREISSKKTALVGVLQSEHADTWLSMLHALPGASVDCLFSWCAFSCHAVHKNAGAARARGAQ